MKRIFGFALGSVLCLALAGVAATAADSDYTVGDFAVTMATTMNLTVPQAGFNAETAAAALREAGVVVKGDLKSALKESDVVNALSQLGLNLTTGNPDRSVSQSRADQILKAFDGALTPGVESSDHGNDPPGGGFGRGGKKQSSPSDGGR
jgi:hypothetical protein